MNHDTIIELLPWYVNGTLPPHERAAVEAELSSCPLCAAELENLQRVHAALHEIDQDAPGPSESLMSRTLARIDADPQRPGVMSWLNDALSTPGWWRQVPAVAWFGAGAAVVVALLLIIGRGNETAVNSYQPQQPLVNRVVVAPPPVAGQPAAREADQTRTLGAVTSRNAPVEESKPAAAPASVAGAVNLQSEGTLAKLKTANAQAPVGQRPQLIRTGNIDLLVPDVEHALVQLQVLAQAQFGDVTSLTDQTPSTPGVRHSANVEIAIPADRFDQTMNALAQFGAVQARTISAENVTDQIVDGQARLRNLRRTESDMLRILDRAGKIPDVLDVTQQIAQVREQIETLDAQVQSLQHQVAYSTITIGIEDEKPVASAEPGVGTQLGDAWNKALRDVRNFSVRLASAVLVIIAFAPYWLILLIIGLFIAYRLRR